MIELKPFTYSDFFCPECKARANVIAEDVMFPGTYVYADCLCMNCGLSYYQLLPVGHGVDAPLAVRKADGHVYNSTPDSQWLCEHAVNSFPLVDKPVGIHKIIYHERKEVVLLNALDFLYGHSLLKLYNAQHHLDHDKHLGLILIIPRSLQWMIPEGCAEAWVVDLSLSDLQKGYTAISDFVAQEVSRFDKVYLSRAYSHPDFSLIDITRFTGVEPFHASDFYRIPPRITFILREDRWWFGNTMDYWFYRICRRFKMMKLASKVLTGRQNNLVKRTIHNIAATLPHAEFAVVGLGRTGAFTKNVLDHRTMHMNDAVERTWCEMYGDSHVVVGVHGSNMLLPTAFSAGCVEILPEDRYGNIVQDLSVRYSDRRQLFFYRFADQYASPANVAVKVISIILDYKSYKTNMCDNVYQTEPVTEINADNDRHHGLVGVDKGF